MTRYVTGLKRARAIPVKIYRLVIIISTVKVQERVEGAEVMMLSSFTGVRAMRDLIAILIAISERAQAVAMTNTRHFGMMRIPISRLTRLSTSFPIVQSCQRITTHIHWKIALSQISIRFYHTLDVPEENQHLLTSLTFGIYLRKSDR